MSQNNNDQIKGQCCIIRNILGNIVENCGRYLKQQIKCHQPSAMKFLIKIFINVNIFLLILLEINKCIYLCFIHMSQGIFLIPNFFFDFKILRDDKKYICKPHSFLSNRIFIHIY